MLQFRSGHLLGLRGDQHAMPMGCNDFAGDQGRAIGVPRCRETHQTGGFSSFCFDYLWGIQSKGGENYGKLPKLAKYHFFPLLNNFCKPTEFRRHFLTFPSDEVPCTSWIWKQECLFPVILLHTRVPKKASNFLWGVTAKLHQASFRNKLYM
jgi:hypothetical protein